jgi:hypothetical protein
MPRWTTEIKRTLYPLFIYPKVTAAKRRQLHALFDELNAGESFPELKVFSNREEDGIILWLLAAIGCKKGVFLDIGSNDCINSNCANLAFNFDWEGVFADVDQRLLNIGRRMYHLFKKRRLRFVQKKVNRESVNELSIYFKNREIDFLNIDVDGDDYAIWEGLSSLSPKIVLIETKIEYGRYHLVIPANERFAANEWGASLVSMTELAHTKGYALVATNREGFNAFYLRRDVLASSHVKELSLESVLSDVKGSFYNEETMTPLLDRLQQFSQR